MAIHSLPFTAWPSEDTAGLRALAGAGLGDPDDVRRVIRDPVTWLLRGGRLSRKEEPSVLCGSRGASGRAGGRNLQDAEQKDARLAAPRGQGSQGHAGRGVSGFVGGSRKLALFPTGKKYPRRRLCRRGKQSGSISHGVLGLTAWRQCGGLNKPLSTALGSPLPGAEGCPRTSSVLPALFPKLHTYTRGSTA